MEFEPSKQTILIVDDMPINIQVLARMFKDEYQVKIATGGEKALEIALSDPQPDLILLDIIMPAMDGYEVCKRLKSDPCTRHIPVIFITAKGEEEDETQGLELGAADYISKPFSGPIVKARAKAQLRLKLKSDVLEHHAALDPLTEIPNRRRFNEILDTEWNRAKRSAAPLSMLMMDIDSFKAFNDHYGHTAGDECLRQIAQTLHQTLKRAGDFVARYGGEEFAAVLPTGNATGAAYTAEMLRSRVEALQIPHAQDEAARFVTLSIGGATVVPNEFTTPHAFLEAADQMLFEAKRSGRNRIRTVEL